MQISSNSCTTWLTNIQMILISPLQTRIGMQWFSIRGQSPTLRDFNYCTESEYWLRNSKMILWKAWLIDRKTKSIGKVFWISYQIPCYMASVHQFGGQKSMTQIYFEVCINTDMLTTKLSGMQQNIVSQSLKKLLMSIRTSHLQTHWQED